MDFWKLIIYLALGLFIVLCVLFPEFRALFLGWTKMFVRDVASTPEGAEAVYTEKIDQAQETYESTSEAYKRAAGKCKAEKEKLEKLNGRLKQVEAQCQNLATARRVNELQIKAEERTTILNDIERSQKLVSAYEAAEEQAKEVYEMAQRNLIKLKREREEVVGNMKANAELKEIYRGMDELSAKTGTDKLLKTIRERNQTLQEDVGGAKALYDKKLSVRSAKADSVADQEATDAYIAQLLNRK